MTSWVMENRSNFRNEQEDVSVDCKVTFTAAQTQYNTQLASMYQNTSHRR